MTCALPHAFRGAAEADAGLLVHSWTMEMRKAPSSWSVPNEVYSVEQRRLVRGLLASSLVIVAHNPEDVNHIYGFVCAGDGVPVHHGPPATLHWLYVKDVYRRCGLGLALLERMLGPTDARGPVTLSQVPKLFTGLAERGSRPDLLTRWKLVPNPYVLHRRASVQEAA